MAKNEFTHYKCKHCKRVYSIEFDKATHHLEFVSQEEAVALVLAGRVHPNPSWCSMGCPALEPEDLPPQHDTRSGGVRST